MMVFALIDAATPTWGPMNVQLGFSYDILNDSYAIGCGTLAFGAALLIPFALKYGRRPIYIFSTAIQLAISIWSAKIQTVADIMLVNVFSCLVGALAEVIVQMTIADVYFTHERGRMNSIFIWVENVGGSLAPLAAGYITISQGWRWTWWWCAILFAVALVVYIFAYEETKFDHASATPYTTSHEVLDGLRAPHNSGKKTEEKAGEKSGTTDDKELPSRNSDSELGSNAEDAMRQMSVIHIDPSIPRKTYLQRLAITTTSPGSFNTFFRHCYQPFMILVTIPAVGYMSMVYRYVI